MNAIKTMLKTEATALSDDVRERDGIIAVLENENEQLQEKINLIENDMRSIEVELAVKQKELENAQGKVEELKTQLVCERSRNGYAQTEIGDLDFWILPFFKDRMFFDISSVTIGEFIRCLKHRSGEKTGKPLSHSRISNILLPLRALWNDACDEFRWELPNPFRQVDKQMPKPEVEDECLADDGTVPVKIVKPRDLLRFDEFQAYLDNIDPWYRPVAELWAMTGLIPSEMAGITPFHIRDGYIHIRRSISRGVERKAGKTMYRRREIKITPAIQRIIDIFLARGGRRLITLKSGKPLTPTEFYDAWVLAGKAANLPHRVPYVLRHTFAAWALVIGIDQNRFVGLMGHSSKQMVYEVYGAYVEGLVEDRAKILAYYGADFVAAELGKAA